MSDDRLKKARREAHETCPFHLGFAGGGNDCGKSPCIQWEGHKKLDRLCKLERLAALEDYERELIIMGDEAPYLTSVIQKARRAVEES